MNVFNKQGYLSKKWLEYQYIELRKICYDLYKRGLIIFDRSEYKLISS